MAHITTASKVVKDDWYAKKDTRLLKEIGFKVKEIDIAEESYESLKSKLADKDIIYVQGGNGFYLLKMARKSGFGKIIKELVAQGNKIYIGKSSGSYLVCPTLEMHTWSTKKWRRFDVTDLTALSLVPFILKAHYTEDQKEELESKINACKYPVKLITDDQLIYVNSEELKILP